MRVPRAHHLRPDRGLLTLTPVLAALVARAKRHFIEGGWARRCERLTGAVLLGLGVRLALERR